MNTPQAYFDHEKLVAYQRSIQFVVWVNQILENIPSKLAVHDQLDRASTSVPLNIAEGNAKYTAPDQCRYFDTARGSALECAACLDVLVAKSQFTADEVHDGKALLHETVSLLVGLIRSFSPERLGEHCRHQRPQNQNVHIAEVIAHQQPMGRRGTDLCHAHTKDPQQSTAGSVRPTRARGSQDVRTAQEDARQVGSPPLWKSVLAWQFCVG